MRRPFVTMNFALAAAFAPALCFAQAAAPAASSPRQASAAAGQPPHRQPPHRPACRRPGGDGAQAGVHDACRPAAGPDQA